MTPNQADEQGEWRLVDAYNQLVAFWNLYSGCPCGARKGAEHSHPHVMGCPTATAIKWWIDMHTEPALSSLSRGEQASND